MAGRTYRIVKILTGMFVGTALAGYSFEPACLMNSYCLSYAQINDSGAMPESCSNPHMALSDPGSYTAWLSSCLCGVESNKAVLVVKNRGVKIRW